MSEETAAVPRMVRVEALDLQDGSSLRIEWIGNVVGMGTRFVRVDVSKVRGLSFLRSKADHLQTIEVPVSFLSELRLGDVWKGGIRQSSDLLATELFKDLQIDGTTTTVAAIGEPLNKDAGPPIKYAVPFSQYSAYSNHTSSFIARVRVNETTFLIVPSMEIIRFYFAHYGSFTKLMFSGGLDRSALRKGCTLSSQTGIANVVLPKNVHRPAASAIARIAFDDAAGKAYSQLIKSGTIAALNSSHWYPKMGFPIAGSTNLQARGRWIEHEGEKTFVVAELLSCSHPLPYRGLYYHRLEEMLRPSDAPVFAKTKPQQAPAASTDTPFTLTTQPIGKGPRISVRVPRQSHQLPAFPDLEGKELKRGNDNPLHIRRSDIQEMASASLGGVRGGDGPEAVPTPDVAYDRAPTLLGYQADILMAVGCTPIPFANEQLVLCVPTDALPTRKIESYQVWLAFFRSHATSDPGEMVIGLVCLEASLGDDTPEFAVMRLTPGEAAQMASHTIEELRRTLWSTSVAKEIAARASVEFVFTTSEIMTQIQHESIAELLREPLVRLARYEGSWV